MKKTIAAGGLVIASSVSGWSADVPNVSSAPKDPVFNASVDYSVVDKGDVRFRGAQTEMSETHQVSPTIFGRIPINDNWFVPVGVSTEHLFFDSVTGAPVPERINSMRLSAGVGYRLSPEWTVEVAAGPLFYNLEQVDGNTIGFGGMVRASWRINPRMTAIIGLAVAPDSEFPVFPAAGVIWNVSTNFTLNLTAPRLRAVYHIFPKMDVYAGANLRFATFRTRDNIQERTHVAGFNNALGTYRDIHLGAGAEFKVLDGLRAGFEAGYSVGRLIDYTRIDERVRFESAPYVHASVRYTF